ncbi:MAG: saccharopine dehydrogenase NADP-binding domain-containing protein [Deltaproteobacteria bacterium]|nr:saccharopine dehydrogenase NADP-binding domain-containing protein [Deltaproteobacteria bacterium]
MRDVVVLGGYGRVGSACVDELISTTSCRVVIAGPSVQRAERAALTRGPRACGAYANAADPRALGDALGGAAAIVSCASSPPLAALEYALETRTPFVSVTRMGLAESRLRQLGERAWEAQTPIVVHAGAVPGLPGIAADALLRRFDEVRALRIASTGIGTPEPESWGDALRDTIARRDFRAVAAWRLPQRFRFPGGVRLVSLGSSLDLAGFEQSHQVDAVRYCEPDRGPIGKAAAALFGWRNPESFTLVAEAFVGSGREPAGRVVVRAESPERAAAATAALLVRRILDGSVPAGVLRPHEALSPAAALDALDKRGVRVLQH